MNLAEWLQGDHEPSQRLKVVQSLCRTVSDRGGGVTLSLDPARIQVGANGECRLEEGKGPPPGRYRAPEIAGGRAATAQSQVYTVGVLCFEVLGGRPFEARGSPQLRDVRPELPRDLTDAVQACLETDAEWRPKDLSYVLGLVEAMGPSGAPAARAAARPAGRGARATSVSPPPSSPSPRAGPAPRPWPLLVFALVALAASLVTAVVRLRQPIAPPALPPAASAAPLPERSAAGAAPATDDRRAAASSAAGPPAGLTVPVPAPLARASPRGIGVGAAPRAASPPSAAVPGPAVTTASVAPPPAVSGPAATPSAPPVPAMAAAPAAVTSVSPPVLRRGATVLVDVHGVGLRSDHQVRIGRGREPALGVEVMRQRFVGPALLQVLLRVHASAVPGGHVLFLVDGAGNTTNPRPLEISK